MNISLIDNGIANTSNSSSNKAVTDAPAVILTADAAHSCFRIEMTEPAALAAWVAAADTQTAARAELRLPAGGLPALLGGAGSRAP